MYDEFWKETIVVAVERWYDSKAEESKAEVCDGGALYGSARLFPMSTRSLVFSFHLVDTEGGRNNERMIEKSQL